MRYVCSKVLLGGLSTTVECERPLIVCEQYNSRIMSEEMAVQVCTGLCAQSIACAFLCE